MSIVTTAASTYDDGTGTARWQCLLPLVASGLRLASACMAANHRDVAASGLSCLTTIFGGALSSACQAFAGMQDLRCFV